jgi:hypothetical protein
MKLQKLFAVAMPVILLCRFSFAEDVHPPGSEYKSAVLSFPEGGHTLSSGDLTKLNQTIKDAKAQGWIVKVEIAAWSDKNHPSSGDLPKVDRTLAQRRISAIRSALRQDLGHWKISKAFNMAENSNWLARRLHTANADLDAVFLKDRADELARDDFNLIREEGAPSKAVVILRIDKN